MPVNPLPMPTTDPVVIADLEGGGTLQERMTIVERAMRSLKMATAWVLWLSSIAQTQSQQPTRIKAVSLTGQSASIAATDLTGGGASAQGLYRLTFYERITRPATTDSSLRVTFGWTDGGVPQTQSSTDLVTNTTVSHDSGTYLVYSDAVAPITYATTYSTVGATTMLYRVDVTLEQIAA